MEDKITITFEPKTIRLEYNNFELQGSTASFRKTEIITLASIARVTSHRQNPNLLDVLYTDGRVEQFNTAFFNVPFETGAELVSAIENAINNY